MPAQAGPRERGRARRQHRAADRTSDSVGGLPYGVAAQPAGAEGVADPVAVAVAAGPAGRRRWLVQHYGRRCRLVGLVMAILRLIDRASRDQVAALADLLTPDPDEFRPDDVCLDARDLAAAVAVLSAVSDTYRDEPVGRAANILANRLQNAVPAELMPTVNTARQVATGDSDLNLE